MFHLFFLLIFPSCYTNPEISVPKNPVPSASASAIPWSPPGTQHPDNLSAKLDQAWKNREPEYKPRTHHLQPDGSPKYINRLFFASSPYLRQHAHNPVNWHSWSQETLAKAKREKKPIFLSVGYATCHWCHVMEEESFEDEEIAIYLNQHYIPIKVDREERPDVDAIYMRAVRVLQGRGGWPMSVWLTSDAQPFYAETYIPARDGDRGRQVGFLTLLSELHSEFESDPDNVMYQATRITRKIQSSLSRPRAGALPSKTIIEDALKQSTEQFDPILGGRKGRPKFPSSFPLPFLLQQASWGNKDAQEMAGFTLKLMADGGIYDHISGGFHRYSVDSRWLVPHFEKMLYDNAQLAVDYLRAGQTLNEPRFTAVSEDILTYVQREMTDTQGGFFAATDADSQTPNGEMEEGWFFTWTIQELNTILSPDELDLVVDRYGLTKKGNFEGRNILTLRRSLAEISGKKQEADLKKELEAIRVKIREARTLRPPPLLDNKIITAWNGLMISAFAKAGFQLKNPSYLSSANQAALFLLKNLQKDNQLLRIYAGGKAQHIAYIEDHAFVVSALLDLFEATGEPQWLQEAFRLDQAVEQNYEDSKGGWYRVHKDYANLLVRETPSHDGAEPSGASVMIHNLLRFSALTTDKRYQQRADRALKAYGGILSGYPLALDDMLLAVDWKLHPPKELIIIASTPQQAEPMLNALRASPPPNYVLVQATQPTTRDKLNALLPPLPQKTMREEKCTAYVCQGGVCDFPTTDVKQFTKLIKKP